LAIQKKKGREPRADLEEARLTQSRAARKGLGGRKERKKKGRRCYKKVNHQKRGIKERGEGGRLLETGGAMEKKGKKKGVAKKTQSFPKTGT